MVSKILLKLVYSLAFALISIALAFHAQTSYAESSPPHQSTSNQKSSLHEKEYAIAIKAAIKGRAIVPLLDQGSLTIPKNCLFIPAKEASIFMKANGEVTKTGFVGLIISKIGDLRWYITVDFIKSGYLRDGDAKSWTADDLLKSLKENSDYENNQRIANDLLPLEIVDWIKVPQYNQSTHQLIWSVLVNEKDHNSDPAINYNTYILGKEGYFRLDLVTHNSTIAQDKFIVQKILDSLHYNKGKRYEDFSEERSLVATYGLTSLIIGVAKK